MKTLPVWIAVVLVSLFAGVSISAAATPAPGVKPAPPQADLKVPGTYTNGKWKYIHTDGEVPQLYDVNSDRLERTNLAVDPAYADLCKRLSDRVHQGWEKPDPEVIVRRPKPF